jgi:DNA-binding transcriptional LysR family regulator
MTSIRFLRTFIAAAQGGSFTAAAEKVALTQAAVGSQIHVLEQDLKQKLFDKTGRAMVLSAAGRALLPRAEQLVADYETLRRDLQNPRQQIAGNITIGTMITAMGLLSRVLADLKALHPELDVHLNLREGDALSALVRRGEIDAAVLVEASLTDFSGMQWTRLYEEPFVFIASSAVATPQSDIAQLLQVHPFLRFDRRRSTGIRVEQILRRRGLVPRDFIELNSLPTIVELVRQGTGVTLIPLLKTFGWERDPTLCVIPLSGRPGSRRVGMLERTESSLATRVFRDHLVARLAQMKQGIG